MDKMCINIGICDDQSNEIERIVNYCNSYFEFKYMECEFKVFNSGEEVLGYKGEPLDIIFLDIDLPGISGIQVKDGILNRTEFKHIVFVSGYDNYIFDAFSIKTIGYEIKPCTQVRINKYLSQIVQKKNSEIIIKFEENDADKFVFADDLYYLKGCNNYSEVFARDKHFIIVCTLKQIEERFDWLPLVRVHRSYLVNMATSHMKKDNIIFGDCDTVIKCSRRNFAIVKERYSNYEFRRGY